MLLRGIAIASYFMFAFSALSAPSHVLTREVELRAGRTAQVEEFYEFHPRTCKSIGTVRIKVLLKPKHGTVKVSPGTSKIKANSKAAAHCRGKAIGSNIVTYTPAPGYKGNDFLNLQITSVVGEDFTMPTSLIVK